jgi:hypothetical protein
MTEIADVREVMAAFEDTNRARVEVRWNIERQVRGTDVLLTMIAHPWEGEIGEVPPLASVSVKCSGMNLKTWNAALTHCMYALDFKLALIELGSVSKER